MANLIVTFTKAFPNVAGVEIGNVAIGSEARTEQIALAATDSTAGNLVARRDENIVELWALADCWVKIGAAPVAAVGEGRYLAAGSVRDLFVNAGDKVAAIEA